MKNKSFFIAGIMQGNKSNSGMSDQTYRGEIADIILRHFPRAFIFDPLIEQLKRFGTRQERMLESASKLDDIAVLYPAKMDKELVEMSQSFHEICQKAAECDVLISYIPKGEVSMGTAVEMYSSWLKRKTVITISRLRQNLTLLACSDVIVPDIKGLDELLGNGFLSI
jgi:hypothetical protein